MPKKAKKKSRRTVAVQSPKVEATPLKFWKKSDNEFDVVTSPSHSSNSGDRGMLFMEKMKEVFGVEDFELAHSIFRSSSAALEAIVGEVGCLNIIAQSANDLSPKDAIEARLAVQAAVAFAHGMECFKKAGNAEMINQKDSYVNTGCKLLRIHNETIEALNRYRRGGEQKVTVTHAVLAHQAVVNNFQGVGVPPENKGETPCQLCAELKQEPIKIDPVVNQPCQTGGVDSMVDDLLAPRRNRGESG